MSDSRPRAAASLFALVLLAVSSHAADWPQWRGPERSGVSAETGLARSWPQNGPPAVWEIETLGDGYGSVAIVKDRIYVQGTTGNESRVFALDRTSGRQIWTTALGPKLRNGRGDGPRATPTIDGQMLYALNGRGELAALRTRDGLRIWQANILTRFGGKLISWGISESPLVEGELVVVSPGGPDASVVALDKTTGRTVWTSRGLSDRAGHSSIVAVDVGPTRALAAFTQRAGVGVRASDGALLWRYERPANRTSNAATPVVGDDMVFYSSSYGVGGGAIRLRPTAEGIETEEVYFATQLQNHHGGVVLVGGHLYSFFGRVLTCVDFRTGDIRWRARSVGKGSVTSADGLLFLVGEGHQVGLAEATPDGYRELGRFRIENRGRPSWAHPVVHAARLYIRNREALSVYDVAE